MHSKGSAIKTWSFSNASKHLAGQHQLGAEIFYFRKSRL